MPSCKKCFWSNKRSVVPLLSLVCSSPLCPQPPHGRRPGAQTTRPWTQILSSFTYLLCDLGKALPSLNYIFLICEMG